MEKLTKSQIITIISKQFDTLITITENSSMDTIEEWDSLIHLGILVALDVELEGEAASVKKLAGCRSVKEIISCLDEAGLIADK